MIGLAFFVYKRPDLTQKVLESIKRNQFEKIYVFQDGLRNEKDRKCWEEVNNLINAIDFMETEVIVSDVNKGLANSIIDGMNYVFSRHEVAIALEDDVVLADGYKEFMQAAFEKYADNKKVMSMCGGGFGSSIPKDYPYDVYFSYRMSSIGFGTWKDRWDTFERNPWMLKKIKSNPPKAEMLKWAGNDLEVMVNASISGHIDTWATYWALHQINHEAYHLMPVLEYAKDMGRIGGGTNTVSETYRFETVLNGIKKEQFALPDEVVLDERITSDICEVVSIGLGRDKYYYDVLSDWFLKQQNGLKISSYFEQRNISNAYIYGLGKIAMILNTEIKESISVEAFIVENKNQTEYLDKHVFEIRELQDTIKSYPVIVIPGYDIRIIRYLFKKYNLSNEFITLDELVQGIK